MIIEKMFAKNINREITGVIKVGQIEEENKKEELIEYVVTNELAKHFSTFFANYAKSIQNPTDEMGVWISGFFGSGKSHFLKILSYVLDNTEVAGKKAASYFKDKDTLTSDGITLGNMELAARTKTKAILFNVDSKAASTGKSDSNAIVLVFNRVFNEKLGYCGAIPALADLERELDNDGRFEEFQKAFEQIYGHSWLESRNKFRVIRDKVKQALVQIGYMSEEAASAWAGEATSNYSIAIEDFAARVQDYVEKTGERVVFLVDEIGQFISGDSKLMLNLQTLTEDLGSRCKGKVWVVVTAQQDIDSITDEMKNQNRRNDFSRIQARFGTRLSLTSANVDEVIRERILKKNKTAEDTLKALYVANETDIHNVVDFKNTVEMKKANSPEEFAAVYPFLPYQFKLLGDVLNSIRLNAASGRNLSEGERSMLGAYQEAAKSVKKEKDGVLVPFYCFYDNLVMHLDHTHAGVIQRAQDNERLNPNHEADCFPVNVLKTLFLLKYVKGVPMTLNNIQALMTTNIKEKKADLKNRIEDALTLLKKELLVQQIQDTYEFLTDEEQDINREIERRNIQPSEIIAAATNMVYDQIYAATRYKVEGHGGKYTFAFNQAVDNQPKKTVQNSEIGIRLITPDYDGAVDDGSMVMLSSQNSEAILVLPSEQSGYLKDLRNALKIEDYIRKVADPQKGKSTIIRSTKSQEATQAKQSALSALKDAIGEATIFVNGNKNTDVTTHDAASRMAEALGKLVDSIYFKLSYMQAPKEDADIKKLFKENPQTKLGLGEAEEPNVNALKDLKDFVSMASKVHNMVSMKTIVDKFTKKPYGFTDSDIRYLAAQLFKAGDLSATVDKEPITLFSRTPEELGNYFTNKKYPEKLLFMVRETISTAKLKACKEVMKELFMVTEATDDADKLMARFGEEAEKLCEKCQTMLGEHEKIAIEYKGYHIPGETVLRDALQSLADLKSAKDAASFFEKIAKCKDRLLDIADDFHPVDTFYGNDKQKEIFSEKGLKALKFYDGSKEHIHDEKLVKVVEQIRDIVNDKKPYKKIKDLPELYDTFIELYGGILEEKMASLVKPIIEQDRKTVLERLAGKEYEEELKNDVVKAFTSLEEEAEKANDISYLLGFKDKADSLCESWMDTLAKKDEELAAAKRAQGKETEKPKPSVKVKPKKTVLARTITSKSWVIENEADLDTYLDTMKKQILKQMDDGHTVIISF